jgi:hypothetical protein
VLTEATAQIANSKISIKPPNGPFLFTSKHAAGEYQNHANKITQANSPALITLKALANSSPGFASTLGRRGA